MFYFDSYDIIIVGCGPAGMTAALYACRSNKRVIVIEKEAFGGQISHSPKVENYPGTMEMSGADFADRLLEQIQENGAEIVMGEVTNIEDFGDTKQIYLKDGTSYEGKTVILANGVKHRMLNLEHEEALVGHGIHMCAVCDGNLYSGKKAVVIGGGNTALQEAVMLSDLCRELVIVQDMPFLTGEQKLQDILESKQNVNIICNSNVDAYLTDGEKLTGLSISNKESSQTGIITCDGCFLAIGLVPQNDTFAELVQLDDRGDYKVGESCCTDIPGLFIAGDCRQKNVRQITTAISDGATAALAACRFLDSIE